MPVNQNDSMSATAIIGYRLYISHDLNTLKACNAQVTHSQIGLEISHRYHPASSVAIRISP